MSHDLELLAMTRALLNSSDSLLTRARALGDRRATECYGMAQHVQTSCSHTTNTSTQVHRRSRRWSCKTS